MQRTMLAMFALVALMTLLVSCTANDVGCTTSALSMARYSDKLDFVGRWEHVAMVEEIDGELPIEIGMETPPQMITWTFTEEFLLAGDEPLLAFAIDQHVTLGTIGDGHQCVVMDMLDWSERGHFRIDWSTELVAMGSVPGAVEEWLIEPTAFFVDSSDLDLYFPVFHFGEDLSRLETIIITVQYVVRPCSDCEISIVRVSHRFERLD